MDLKGKFKIPKWDRKKREDSPRKLASPKKFAFKVSLIVLAFSIAALINFVQAIDNGSFLSLIACILVMMGMAGSMMQQPTSNGQ